MLEILLGYSVWFGSNWLSKEFIPESNLELIK